MVIELIRCFIVIYVNAVTLSPARLQIIALPHHRYSLNSKGARYPVHRGEQGAVSSWRTGDARLWRTVLRGKRRRVLPRCANRRLRALHRYLVVGEGSSVSA
jgi:hypothetical protein